jgi:hypothetical protein
VTRKEAARVLNTRTCPLAFNEVEAEISCFLSYLPDRLLFFGGILTSPQKSISDHGDLPKRLPPSLLDLVTLSKKHKVLTAWYRQLHGKVISSAFLIKTKARLMKFSKVLTPWLVLVTMGSITNHSNVALAESGTVAYRVYGQQANDKIGSNLSLISDVNGDQIDDIIYYSSEVGTPELPNSGMVGVISGANGTKLFEIRGALANDSLGSGSVKAVADANGDGVADILISSPTADSATLVDCGEWRLISGIDGSEISKAYGTVAGIKLGENGIFSLDLNGDQLSDVVAVQSLAESGKGSVMGYSNVGSILYTIPGSQTGDALGRSGTYLLTDIDNDTITDYIVSSTAIDHGTTVNCGGFKLISGATGLVLLDGFGDFTNDTLGRDFVFTSFDFDADSDGVPDFIVASANADSAEGANDNVGIVKVYSSGTRSLLYSVRGRFALDRLSLDTSSVHGSVQFVPDLNSDGITDIVVNGIQAPSAVGLNDNAGLSRVISGASGAVLYDVEGRNTDGRLNYIPLGAFDVTGDGISELFFRSVGGDSNGSIEDNVGRIRMVNGATGTTLYERTGEFSNDGTPNRIGIVNDLTGDGIVDLWYSATAADSQEGLGDDVGRISFINGATGSLINSQIGQTAGDNLGFTTALSGEQFDLDRDGTTDVLLFSTFQDAVGESLSDRGGVTAFNSRTGDVSYRIFGTFPQDQLGTAVNTVGDINGDGVTDYYLSTPFGDSQSGASDDVGYIGLYSGASGAKLFEILGERANDRLSSATSVTLDINHDGLLDLVTGSPLVDSSTNEDAGMILAIVSDACGSNDQKTVPGLCGCNTADIDSDLDGTLDCFDGCANDASKTNPGSCGCGVSDVDLNQNGIVDCSIKESVLLELDGRVQLVQARAKRGKASRKFLKNNLGELRLLISNPSLTFSPSAGNTKEEFLARIEKLTKGRALSDPAKEKKSVAKLSKSTVSLIQLIKRSVLAR